MKEELNTLGRKIAQLRIKKGFTQEKLADMVGYSSNHISKLESARTNPSFELLVDIANALNIELKDLFDFSQYQTEGILRKRLQKIIASSKYKELKLLYNIFSIIDK